MLKLKGQSLRLDDYFAPFNVDKLDADDSDLGSGGPVLLPAQSGPHQHLVVIAGKGGTIYLIDRDHMGHYQPNDDSHAVQTIPSAGGGVFGSMAYWNHNLYVLSYSSKDALRQFFVHGGKLILKAASGSRIPATVATPTVSANGARDGVLWVLRPKNDGNGILYAFDAADSSHLLYDSEQNPSRDRTGETLHFNIPTIMNGHVYVGAKHEVDVYGLLRRAQQANEQVVATAPIVRTGQERLANRLLRMHRSFCHGSTNGLKNRRILGCTIVAQ